MPDTPACWRERLAAVPFLAFVPSVAPRVVALAAAAAGVSVAAAVGFVALRGAPPAPEISLPMAAGAGGPAAMAGGRGPGGAPGAGDGTGGTAPQEGTGSSGPAPAGAGEGVAYVHAAGAVARPGVYRVRPSGRVADLVDAAGGPAPDADLDQLNLAARLTDGERVYVPRRGESPPPAAAGTAAGGTGGGGAGSAGGALLDLNTATLDQLDALPGVGPATAQAILDYRREHGRFAQVQELLEVRGIGEAKLAALRSRVRV